MYNIYYNNESDSMYQILERKLFIYAFKFNAAFGFVVCSLIIGIHAYLFYGSLADPTQLKTKEKHCMIFSLIFYILIDLALISCFTYWLFHDIEYKWKYIYHKLDEHQQDFINQSVLWNAFVIIIL